MRIGVIGAGYVGLVAGTCLAEMGNDVILVDNVREKVEALNRGVIPIYEPGLEELVKRNRAEGRLAFTTDTVDAVRNCKAIFLAVGTPQGEDGSADMQYMEKAARDVAAAMDGYRLIVVKSTVPVGTNRKFTEIIKNCTKHKFDLASNPEFLKEGAAVDDFMYPDRVVAGVRTERAGALMREIYAPFVRTGHPIMVVDPESAEMVKYVSNALLASRISFMNEMAAICSAVGADIDLVRKGVGTDRRIGQAFLFPGLGYGGSCFPKDVRALTRVAEDLHLTAPICKAIDEINVRQRSVLLTTIREVFGDSLSGKTFAIWGLAFKPKTDDVREAPALYIARELVRLGAKVKAYDPVAMETTRRELGDMIAYTSRRYEATQGSDALIVCTEWNEFRSPDFGLLKKNLKQPVIFDGRNIYDLNVVRDAGFNYFSVGRPPVRQG
jgi:UDPglucose 6-dehydrogenase